MTDWQPARLIPTSGIRSSSEAEARATSAVLAVLTTVRPLSKALLVPLGASRADRALVEAFIEVPFESKSGKTVRPDGLVRVSYGKQDPWVALVEVKTGTDILEADQLNEYWDIARAERYDAVISISNEIAPSPGVHPVEGLRVRANSRVAVHHLSWTMILTEAVKQKVHRGVEDPEQAWILGELIRYLEHPSSGAMEFDDMGPNWVSVRDGAQAAQLSSRDPAVVEIAQRWDQFMRFAALRLGSETGSEVEEVVPRSHQKDPSLRTKSLVDSLADLGRLEGAIHVPDTVADIEFSVDFRSRQIRVSTSLAAPDDRGARARVTWLVRQLDQAAPSMRIEAYAKNVRTPTAAELGELRDDPAAVIGEKRREPSRFTVAQQSQMGLNRKTGRSPGFADSVLAAISTFYEDVMQHLTAFQRKAPVRKAPEPVQVEELSDDRPARVWVASQEPVAAPTEFPQNL